jgi:hypothetical protein
MNAHTYNISRDHDREYDLSVFVTWSGQEKRKMFGKHIREGEVHLGSKHGFEMF